CLGLTLLEVLSVALAVAVDDDALAGRAIAYAQAPIGGSRPTLGLIAAAFAEVVPDGARPIHVILGGAALRSGLLAPPDEAAPLPARALPVPVPLALGPAGHDGIFPGATLGVDRRSDIPFPPSILDAARRHAAALPAGAAAQRALVVRTPAMAEGRAVAAAIA